MSTKHIWMVRSDQALIDDYWDKNIVAIGWTRTGDWVGLKTRDDFRNKLKDVYPERTEKNIIAGAGQCYRFYIEVQIDDYVLTYNKSTREYFAGEIVGDCRFAPSEASERYPHIRNVRWLTKIPRDSFSLSTKNALGSALTVFLCDQHFDEIEPVIKGQVKPPDEQDEKDDATSYFDDVKEQADELIADSISKIDPYDFEELVAAVLRAMGFRTTVTPPGPDSGVDIVAHPDAFGFQTPIIKVQVKHRTSTASGPDMRNFIATLKDGENGLFVSTGGFTRDAYLERDKAYRPIKAIDRDEFVDLLIENYENLEPEYKTFVPLRKVYIPTRA